VFGGAWADEAGRAGTGVCEFGFGEEDGKRVGCGVPAVPDVEEAVGVGLRGPGVEEVVGRGLEADGGSADKDNVWSQGDPVCEGRSA
jgi:hypothetical protein